MASVAETLVCEAVVRSRAWAEGRDGVARVGDGAPAVAAVEGQAVTAVVVARAAGRDGDAGAFGSAPAVAGGADACVGGAVVVERAFGGDVVAGVCRGAPGSAGHEGQTSAAVVADGAAAGNLNA